MATQHSPNTIRLHQDGNHNQWCQQRRGDDLTCRYTGIVLRKTAAATMGDKASVHKHNWQPTEARDRSGAIIKIHICLEHDTPVERAYDMAPAFQGRAAL